jgi:DNA-binding XRE family transcriptional regulator
MARQHVLAAVESRFAAPIKDILNGLVSEGLNKETAAKKLGVTKNTLLKWIDQHNVDWPRYTKEHAAKRGNWLRERSLYMVEHKGEEKPLFDAAKEEGIPYNVIIDRFKNGDRGERLFRKVRKYRKAIGAFEKELTKEEWDIAVELAQAIGTKRAAQKMDIPMSILTRVIQKRSK